MVVTYPCESEGSPWSFITIDLRIIFWRTGSSIPNVFPQVLITLTCSGIAVALQEFDMNPCEGLSSEGFTTLGVLLSFLLVFKTQFAYQQFNRALGHVDGMLQVSRSLAMVACAMFDWEKHPDVHVRVRRIIRLIVLNFFVVVEYFQRTGENRTLDKQQQDKLRSDIQVVAGAQEFLLLYPDEKPMSGSQSKFLHTNPTMVLYWIMLSLGRIQRVGGCSAPLASNYVSMINALAGEFWGMNTIDKTQFPLPYAQIVKVLTLIYTYSWPFFMVEGSRYYTPVLAMLLSLGFFGLDEVAEILQSPFGNDPNDIHLNDHGALLMQDLELMFHGRQTQLDSVFAEDSDVNFSALLDPFVKSSLVRQITNNTVVTSADCHNAYMQVFASPSAGSGNARFFPDRGDATMPDAVSAAANNPAFAIPAIPSGIECPDDDDDAQPSSSTVTRSAW